MIRDIALDTFDSVLSYDDLTVNMIIITYNTRDYGNNFVARLRYIKNGHQKITPYIIIKTSLKELRNCIPEYMHRIEKDEKDNEVIIESYI